MTERLTTNQKAVGSNPAGRTSLNPYFSINFLLYNMRYSQKRVIIKKKISPQRVIDLHYAVFIIKITNEEFSISCIWMLKTENMEGGNII